MLPELVTLLAIEGRAEMDVEQVRGEGGREGGREGEGEREREREETEGKEGHAGRAGAAAVCL